MGEVDDTLRPKYRPIWLTVAENCQMCKLEVQEEMMTSMPEVSISKRPTLSWAEVRLLVQSWASLSYNADVAPCIVGHCTQDYSLVLSTNEWYSGAHLYDN